MAENEMHHDGRSGPLEASILDAAAEVHRLLGPGLLEGAYEECLAFELFRRGLPFERQRPLPVVYKDLRVDGACRLDLVVRGAVLVQARAVERLESVHAERLLACLRLSGLPVGLLLNFHASALAVERKELR